MTTLSLLEQLTPSRAFSQPASQTQFLNGTSATKSLPPLVLSARNTLPVHTYMSDISSKDLRQICVLPVILIWVRHIHQQEHLVCVC